MSIGFTIAGTKCDDVTSTQWAHCERQLFGPAQRVVAVARGLSEVFLGSSREGRPTGRFQNSRSRKPQTQTAATAKARLAASDLLQRPGGRSAPTSGRLGGATRFGQLNEGLARSPNPQLELLI